jgi:hypothetical protein
MTRRTSIVVAGVAVLAIGATLVTVLTGARITRANLDRIDEGMARAEVERILGGPPGDYRIVHTKDEPGHCFGGDLDSLASCIDGSPGDEKYFKIGPDGSWNQGLWFGDEGVIQISFRSGIVASKEFIRTVQREQGALENLRWRVERQWHRWFPE